MATHPVHYASLTKTHDGPPCTPTLASAVPMNGYFLPAEGASDKALALFSFSSLAAYEQYRALFGTDPDFIEADRIRDDSGCVLRYERTFMRPGFAAFGHAAITSLVMLSWQNSRRGGEKLRGGDVIDLGCRVGRHDCAARRVSQLFAVPGRWPDLSASSSRCSGAFPALRWRKDAPPGL